MPRKKLSEYRAKQLLNTSLGLGYSGLEVQLDDKDWQTKLGKLPKDQTYVVKVDQAVKGRFKKGLVRLDRSKAQAVADIKELAEQGFTSFLVEPYFKHQQADECYLAINRTRGGADVAYAPLGGVDIEARPDDVQHQLFSDTLELTNIPAGTLAALHETFEANHFSFLEINPLVIKDGQPHLLDAAVEVDDAAEFFAGGRWTASDMRRFSTRAPSEEEQTVAALSEQSQASFSLELINPDGRIFMLLSGGGASVVLADEVKNLGHGQQLANYGEYSGNPNQEETRHYTAQVLSLLVKSKAKNKVLVIAGGVANFTDVRTTFRGIIEALEAKQQALKKQGIKVYVRRGGPFELEGLAMIEDYLRKSGLLGRVAGPELVLTDIVTQAAGGKVAK
jgi:succinyl-CoA synthetase beta subunit